MPVYKTHPLLPPSHRLLRLPSPVFVFALQPRSARKPSPKAGGAGDMANSNLLAMAMAQRRKAVETKEEGGDSDEDEW